MSPASVATRQGLILFNGGRHCLRLPARRLPQLDEGVACV